MQWPPAAVSSQLPTANAVSVQGWSETFAVQDLTDSNGENRSLTAAGRDQQPLPTNRSLIAGRKDRLQACASARPVEGALFAMWTQPPSKAIRPVAPAPRSDATVLFSRNCRNKPLACGSFVAATCLTTSASEMVTTCELWLPTCT